MNILQRWLKTSSPFIKMLMAISVTSALVVGHKTIYAPYVKRSRYRQAEDWANAIIEQEERGEGDANNISY